MSLTISPEHYAIMHAFKEKALADDPQLCRVNYKGLYTYWVVAQDEDEICSMFNIDPADNEVFNFLTFDWWELRDARGRILGLDGI